MTAPLPATGAESGESGARHTGLPTRAFAGFVAFHGLVHIVGFTVPWGFGGPRGVEPSTRLLNGSVEVGDTAVRVVGLVWLAVAFALVLAAVMIWRGNPWAFRSTVALLACSLTLCIAGLPGAVIGLAVDLAALALLAVAPDRLIARPAGRIQGTTPRSGGLATS